MPEQNLLDFTGIRYYDQWFKAHFPDKFATRADLEEVAALAASAYRFMGYVPSKGALPEDAAVGDVYAVGETGDQYAWTGDAWDKVTLDLHLENYVKKGEWSPKGGAMSEADQRKLRGIASRASRVAVDTEASAAVDGDNAALLGSQISIFISSPSGETPAIGAAAEYPTSDDDDTKGVVFWIPADSIVGGTVSAVDIIKPRFKAAGAPAVKKAYIANRAALEFTPAADADNVKTRRNLNLYVEWAPGSDREDGPTDAFGTFDVIWRNDRSSNRVRLTLRWHYPDEAAYCSILAGRPGGLPIGLNRIGTLPGIEQAIIVQTDGLTSKELSISAVLRPDATSPLSSGRLDPSATGMTFDCAELDPLDPLPEGEEQVAPYKQFSNIGVVDKAWRNGLDGHGDVGTFQVTWQRVEEDGYLVELAWELPGALRGTNVGFSIFSGDSKSKPASGALWAFVPVSTTIAVPAAGAQALTVCPDEYHLVNITGTPEHPLPAGIARAYLNPDAEALAFDGATLQRPGDYRYFKDVRVYVEWESPDEEHVNGPTDALGLFAVRWTFVKTELLDNGHGGTTRVREYSATVLWCPDTLRAFHVLANYAAKLELDARLSGADEDCATGQQNGTMSRADKAKLDGIAPGATRFVPEENVASDTKLGLVKVDKAVKNSVNPVQTVVAFNALKAKIDNDAVATADSDGLLPSDGLAKLNSVASGATRVLVDSALNSSSHNTVQNKKVTEKLNALLDQTEIDKLMTVGTEQETTGHFDFKQPMVANLSGTADKAEALATPRKIILSGQMTGSAVVDGSGGIEITTRLPQGVPSAKKGEKGLFLGFDASGKPVWMAPGNDQLLVKYGDQTVHTEKVFADYPDAPPVSAGGMFVPRPNGGDESAVPAVYFRDELRAAVERQSGGRNTVVRDMDGNPHYMVVIPKFRCEDVDPDGKWGLGTGVHPAFIVNGREVPEILIGKYLASGRAESAGLKLQTLPGRVPFFVGGDWLDPKAVKLGVGERFSFNTVANWGALALLSLRAWGEDVPAPGNNSYGCSVDSPWLTAIRADGSVPGKTAMFGVTLSGTGPQEWTHDGTPWGVCDLVGNVNECLLGGHGASGKIMLVKDNDVMAASSEALLELHEDGKLGAAGSGSAAYCAYNATSSAYIIQGAAGAGTVQRVPFATMSMAEVTSTMDFSKAVQLLKRLALYPVTNKAGIKGTLTWATNATTALLARGGSWLPDYEGGASVGGGLFNLLVYSATSARAASMRFGVRLAYLP